MIPYAYWRYGRNVGVQFLDVPYHIPMKCNIMNAVIMSMQMVWFVMILKAAGRYFMKFSGKKKLPNQESNGKAQHVGEVNSNHMQKVD